MTRLYVSPPVAGVSHVGTEPVPGRTEYVRADRLEEAVAVLKALLPSRLCGESWGLPDNETVQIVITFGELRNARAFLAKESDQ